MGWGGQNGRPNTSVCRMTVEMRKWGEMFASAHGLHTRIRAEITRKLSITAYVQLPTCYFPSTTIPTHHATCVHLVILK